MPRSYCTCTVCRTFCWYKGHCGAGIQPLSSLIYNNAPPPDGVPFCSLPTALSALHVLPFSQSLRQSRCFLACNQSQLGGVSHLPNLLLLRSSLQVWAQGSFLKVCGNTSYRSSHPPGRWQLVLLSSQDFTSILISRGSIQTFLPLP